MVTGIGIDIIEIDRIDRAISNERFLTKVYTVTEQNYIRVNTLSAQRAAGIFCAKEAVSKTLGTGIKGFSWTDIEICRNENGKPYVILYNNAKKIFKALGLCDILVSISHSERYAVANAIAVSAN